MADHQYPLFESGQTLTAADLNLLQSFLHNRDRLVGRMVGFGVNCGLAGTVSGSTLTISPGLAVDQFGEPLVLATDSDPISLPPVTVTPSYDFIATSPGGFSVVLEATETVEAAPDCGEADCAGHAELHTRSVELRVVNGRVTGTRIDFSGESLLNVEPVRLAKDSSPNNSFTALRDALATRLTNGTQPLVDPALIAQLQGTSVAAGDLPVVKGYKCGWLNMVLFATLDLLRCEVLMRLSCDRTTKRPGVVLGWVHELAGSGWVFDCSFRHAWEPPRGFSEAFLGGTCSDPCGAYRDAVEALLAGYAPPVPQPGTTPQPPTVCPVGSILLGGKCIHIYFPPDDILVEWSDQWKIDPLAPIWYPPETVEPSWIQPWEIYGTDPWNFLDDGVIGGTDYVGQPALEVKNVLDDFITAGGGVPDVRVLPHAEAQTLQGYLPSGGFSPSDTIVLATNQAGDVVATGRVAAVHNIQTLSAAVPAVELAVADAQQVAVDVQATAIELQQLTGSVTDQFTVLSGTVTNLGVQFDDIQHVLEGIDFAELGGQVQTLQGKVDVLSQFASVPQGPTGISPDVGRGIAEFAETTVSAMKSLEGVATNPNFTRYIADAERAHAAFEVDVETQDPEAISRSSLEVLKSMRTMVKASGVEPELGSQLDAQLRRLGGLYQ